MLSLLAILLLSPEPPPDVYAAAAVARLLTVHGFGAPTPDKALRDAAVELGAQHLEAAPKDAQSAGATLRFVLAKHGVADTHVVPFTLRHRTNADLDDRLPSLIARIESRVAPTHIGTGSRPDGDMTLTTVLLVHRAVQLDRVLPRRLDPGESLHLRGPLLKGYFQPRVLFASPKGGEVRESPAWTDGRSVDATVTFDRGPGAYDVEIVADSPEGPVVLINHRVYAGVQPPSRPDPRPQTDASKDPVRALLALVNAERKADGRNALRWHPILAKVAQSHAQEMAAAKSMRHVLPEGAPLTARLKAEGLKPTAVAENLALADSPEAALAAFLESPGHKRNLLMGQLNYVGIGVVGRYYAVAMARLPW